MSVYSVALRRIHYNKHIEITVWANKTFGSGCHLLNENNVQQFLEKYNWVVIQDFLGEETYYFRTVDHATEFKLTWLE